MRWQTLTDSTMHGPVNSGVGMVTQFDLHTPKDDPETEAAEGGNCGAIGAIANAANNG